MDGRPVDETTTVPTRVKPFSCRVYVLAGESERSSNAGIRAT